MQSEGCVYMYDEKSKKDFIETPLREFKVHKFDNFLSQSRALGDNSFDTPLESFEQTLEEENKDNYLIESTQFIGNANTLIRVNSDTNVVHIFHIKDYYCTKSLKEELDGFSNPKNASFKQSKDKNLLYNMLR